MVEYYIYMVYTQDKGGGIMAFRYNRLWKVLIDKGMNKTELRTTTGISTATLARLSNNSLVSLDVIGKICAALDVQPGEIMEYVEDGDE
jgi:DNA-binding Xre family transcriptional regulator